MSSSHARSKHFKATDKPFSGGESNASNKVVNLPIAPVVLDEAAVRKALYGPCCGCGNACLPWGRTGKDKYGKHTHACGIECQEKYYEIRRQEVHALF